MLYQTPRGGSSSPGNSLNNSQSAHSQNSLVIHPWPGTPSLEQTQQPRPSPQTPRRGRRNGLGPPSLPSGPFSGPGRHTDNRSKNLKRTPLQRLADSRQQGTPVQTHLRNRRRNLRGEEPGTEGSGG